MLAAGTALSTIAPSLWQYVVRREVDGPKSLPRDRGATVYRDRGTWHSNLCFDQYTQKVIAHPQQQFGQRCVVYFGPATNENRARER